MSTMTRRPVWEVRLRELKAFRQRYGHCDVLARRKTYPDLARWVLTQQFGWKQLSAKRLLELYRLDFPFATWDRRWLEFYFHLTAYKRKFGHCRVPARRRGGFTLANWVRSQRNQRHNLPLHRWRLLQRLGFDFSPYKTAWDRQFGRLERFKRKYGHCNVPNRWKPNQSLATWVATQREYYSRLSKERIRRLDALGFVWHLQEQWWEKRFGELKEFKAKHGHANVPDHWPENRQLGIWVGSQRSRREVLPPERKKRLEGMGFVWDVIQAKWEEQLAELERFKNQFGHFKIPLKGRKQKTLADWVKWQRKRKEELSTDQREKLDRLGFEWDPYGSAWEKKFAQLVAFKKRFGHCHVPCRWPENVRLGGWVSMQRQRPHRLSSEQKRRLSRLGFAWRLKQH